MNHYHDNGKNFRILTEIGNLLSSARNLGEARDKEKNKPTLFSLPEPTVEQSKSIENEFKNNLFPLSLFARKGSLLNQKTYDYLNSLSPKNLRGWSTTSPTSGSNPRNDVIYQYLKTFSVFNKKTNGILIKYNQHIGYNFNSKNILLRGVTPQTIKSLKTNKKITIPLLDKESRINKVNTISAPINRLKGVSGLTGYNQSANNRLIKYSYKLLFYFFKSMYCLISKPTFLVSPDKVTIQLFYFLNIPKFKVFKWYSILNNKLIRQKWYSLQNYKLDNLNNSSLANATKAPSIDLSTSSNNYANKGTFIGEDFIKKNQLNTVLSYSNKEMINKVKLSWRIKKTLFRLNKKRNIVKNNLFNLNKFNLFKVFSLKFKLICEILSNKFKKPVELQLIRIHQPFYDSNILVNLLSLNIRNKKFKSNVAIEKLYAKKAVKNLYDYSNKSVNLIPSFLSGIKIRIGGRLMREPIIPRITTKNFERGATSPGKVNFLDTATITKKNRKGSYTIKIFSGQNFF